MLAYDELKELTDLLAAEGRAMGSDDDQDTETHQAAQLVYGALKLAMGEKDAQTKVVTALIERMRRRHERRKPARNRESSKTPRTSRRVAADPVGSDVPF